MQNNLIFHFRPLGPEHLPDLLDIQEEAFSFLQDETLLRRSPPQTLLQCLSPPHFVLGAFNEAVLAGFAILYFGGEGNENLGHDLGFHTQDLATTANLKLVIVRPQFRGHRLQRYLCQQLEATAAAQGIRTICTTVSPENRYSAKNFLAMGYRLAKQLQKYGGLSRNLYVKQL